MGADAPSPGLTDLQLKLLSVTGLVHTGVEEDERRVKRVKIKGVASGARLRGFDSGSVTH